MVLYPYPNPLSSLLCGDTASVSEMKLHMNSEISNPKSEIRKLQYKKKCNCRLELPPSARSARDNIDSGNRGQDNGNRRHICIGYTQEPLSQSQALVLHASDEFFSHPSQFPPPNIRDGGSNAVLPHHAMASC